MTGTQIRQPPDTGNQRRPAWRACLRSLQFKASLLVVLAAVAVTAIGVAVSTRTMSLVLFENEYARTREWADSITAGTWEAVESGDRESLTHTVNVFWITVNGMVTLIDVAVPGNRPTASAAARMAHSRSPRFDPTPR